MFRAIGRALVAAALATGWATYADFTLDWWTVSGGGGQSAGGAFSLSGTIGQPDAGAEMAGGAFAVTGGFWAWAEPGPACTGDVDGDFDVDLTDLALLLTNFGTPSDATREMGDLDGDRDVDLTDLATLLTVFGTVCE